MKHDLEEIPKDETIGPDKLKKNDDEIKQQTDLFHKSCEQLYELKYLIKSNQTNDVELTDDKKENDEKLMKIRHFHYEIAIFLRN